MSKNIIYTHNLDTGLCTATIKHTTFNVRDVVEKIVNQSKYFYIDPNDNLNLDYSYLGKAKCHPEQEYVADAGEYIAKTRCLNKVHRASDRKMRDVILDCRRMLAGLEAYAVRHGIDIDKIPHVDELENSMYGLFRF